MNHTTKDGQSMSLSEMSDSHLMNTLALLRRKAASGVMVEYGAVGESDYTSYDRTTVTGDEALAVLKYDAYVAEARRRFGADDER